MFFLCRLEQAASIVAGLAGIDDLLGPWFRLAEPALKQIDFSQPPPGRRRLGSGLQQVGFGHIVFPLGQIELSQSVQGRGMSGVQFKHALKSLLGFQHFARVEAGPTESVPGVFIVGRQRDGPLELRGGVFHAAVLPKLPSLLCKRRRRRADENFRQQEGRRHKGCGQ